MFGMSLAVPTIYKAHRMEIVNDWWASKTRRYPAFSQIALLFPQHEIDDPAAADVRAITTAMIEDLRILAAGVLNRIGEDGHSVEGAVVVDSLRDADGGGGPPRGIESDGTEGVAENVANNVYSTL